MEFDMVFVAFSFFLGYVTIGVAFFHAIKRMFTGIPTPSIFIRGVDEDLEWNKEAILFVFSIIWPVSWFFFLGRIIGDSIYDKKIIKQNEEDRIAAWFV